LSMSQWCGRYFIPNIVLHHRSTVGCFWAAASERWTLMSAAGSYVIGETFPERCSLAHSPAKGTQDSTGNDQTEDETPLPCVLPCWSLCLAWRRTIITRLT
jgi:hypothetical protein